MSQASRVIDVERLTKSYGTRRGVIELTFSVAPGEVFGYLGPNGAGKTTTIRTLLDFIRPTSGRASIFGLDSHRDSLEIHRRVGYLPGEFGLYEQLTGAEYLAYLGALRGGVDEAHVRTLAARLQLDLSVRIKALSHGNRQKVALAQAFMHRPELLILDEPTQGLDPLMQQAFYSLLDEAREAGRTVFLSSHVMPEVDRVCDRVGIIREGRLVTVEDIGELKAKQLRTLDVHLANHTDPRAFGAVPGVRSAESAGDVLRLTVTGSMDPVVKELARHEVIDVVSHEPTLEDVFLTYYGEESADAGVAGGD